MYRLLSELLLCHFPIIISVDYATKTQTMISSILLSSLWSARSRIEVERDEG